MKKQKKTGSIVDKDGLIDWSMCNAVTDEASVFSALDRMRTGLKWADEKEDFRIGVIKLIEKAFRFGCLTLGDVSLLFGKGVQFLQIAEHCLFPIMHHRISPRPAYVYVDEASQFLDVLLFIAELHDPACDRLRIKRTKYDLYCTCNDTLSNKGKTYTASPSAVLPTMWERELYNDKDFTNEIASYICKIDAPYWMLFSRTGLKQEWFLAFDQNFSFSKTMSVERRDKRQHQSSPDIAEVASTRCAHKFISMIGVPFIRPKPTTFHLWVDGIRWRGSEGRLNISIPSFYTGSHITALRQSDMADIYLLLGKYHPSKRRSDDMTELHSKWQEKTKERHLLKCFPSGLKVLPNISWKDVCTEIVDAERKREVDSDITTKWKPAGSPFIKPRQNDNMLSVAELKKAARIVFSIMHNSYAFPPYTSHEYMAMILSPWWKGEETLNRHLEIPPHVTEEDRKYRSKSVKEIRWMVDEDIKTNKQISGDDKYLWARFCRELDRLHKGLKKVRNAGMAGRYIGKEDPPHKPQNSGHNQKT